jgi:IS5 family transposase
MISKIKQITQKSFSFGFSDTLSDSHPLFILANKIFWSTFEDEFSELYCLDNGRPAKPIRLMVGLIILKHIRNVSDESIVEQWSENVYYQYFCGLEMFDSSPPCAASDLVHFRKRIGEKGMELILRESIRVNGDDSNDPHLNVDTTVQEKNITFPTDTKLQKKVIDNCLKIAKKEKLTLRQTYTRTLKRLMVDLRFSKHPRNKNKAKKARKKIKVIAGRLVRELQRLLPNDPSYQELFELYQQVINQLRNTKNKIYSLHEKEVCCISKGKEHKLYEFGNKASIVTTRSGVIVGAMGFRNEFDGHTLEPALKQVCRLNDSKRKTASVDRGYRGNTQIDGIKIQIPKPFTRNQSEYEKRRLRKAHAKRAAIEPIIGHLKKDHRLGRNFYKGVVGDNFNIYLAAAAFNFKRMMNKWKNHLLKFFSRIFNPFFNLFQLFRFEHNFRISQNQGF